MRSTYAHLSGFQLGKSLQKAIKLAVKQQKEETPTIMFELLVILTNFHFKGGHMEKMEVLKRDVQACLKSSIH